MSSWLCNIEALFNSTLVTSVTCLGLPLTVNPTTVRQTNNLDPCVCLLNLLVLGLPLLPLLTPTFNLPQPSVPVPTPPPITPPNTLPPLPDIPDIPEALPNVNTPEGLAEIFPDVVGDPATCNALLI